MRALDRRRFVPRCEAAAAAGCAVSDPGLLASRIRAVVAASVERVLISVGQAGGPAPMGFDLDHAEQVADMSLHLRQHHAERDLASLGRSLIIRA